MAVEPSCHPPADLVAELTEATMVLAKSIRRAGSERLAPLGVTFAQARLLRLLGDAGQLRMADIAARMGVVPRSATDAVDALQESGLVLRAADPADRRSVRVELTSTGVDLLARMGAARHQAASTVFGRLDEAQRRQLLALLRAAIDQQEITGLMSGKRGSCA